jgi:hypothetical protein
VDREEKGEHGRRLRPLIVQIGEYVTLKALYLLIKHAEIKLS